MEQQRELLRVSQGSWHLANHKGTAKRLHEKIKNGYGIRRDGVCQWDGHMCCLLTEFFCKG